MAAVLTLSVHWSESYVGRPCGDGAFDCVDLAILVQKEVFGHDIQGLAERMYRGHKGIAKFRRMSEEIARRRGDYVDPVVDPKEGDVALIKTRGYFQHVGVFCSIHGEAWILHAADGNGQVVLQRERMLPIRGLTVEGYYRWK
jgi:hypothetical protein